MEVANVALLFQSIHDEYGGKVWLQTLVYGILTIVLWIFSLNYFRQAATSWEQSPAESKVQNKECFFMDFYDEHDMWHFLSAGAMFCSFMVSSPSQLLAYYFFSETNGQSYKL